LQRPSQDRDGHQPQTERGARLKEEGGTSQLRERRDAVGTIEREPEAPQPAHRVGDDRDRLLEFQRVQCVLEELDRMGAHVDVARIYEGIAKPVSGSVEREQPVALELDHQRRPMATEGPATVDKQHRRS
jgi:hypothetical protein